MTLYRVILLWFITAALVAGVVVWANASPTSDRRNDPDVRRAMVQVRKMHDVCQWCGKPGRMLDKLDVVHTVPIGVDGSQAANTNLMRVMHHSCHMVLQHNGDYSGKRYVVNFLQWIDSAEVRTQ
jgi:hypothetical protein